MLIGFKGPSGPSPALLPLLFPSPGRIKKLVSVLAGQGGRKTSGILSGDGGNPPGSPHYFLPYFSYSLIYVVLLCMMMSSPTWPLGPRPGTQWP
eukprot:6435597-Karenia_brevis.AAC.1